MPMARHAIPGPGDLNLEGFSLPGKAFMLIGDAEGWVCQIRGPPSTSYPEQKALIEDTKGLSQGANRPNDPLYRAGAMFIAVTGAPSQGNPATFYIEGPIMSLSYDRVTGFSYPQYLYSTRRNPPATLAFTGSLAHPHRNRAAVADKHFERLYAPNIPEAHRKQLDGFKAGAEELYSVMKAATTAVVHSSNGKAGQVTQKTLPLPVLVRR